MTDLIVLVLAAGQGTRMQSRLPKVLHPLGGRPLLGHVLETVMGLDPSDIIVVTAPETPALDAYLAQCVDHGMPLKTVVQNERKGTAHAVLQARSLLPGLRQAQVLVVYGDVPFLDGRDLRALLARVTAGAPMAILGFEAENPFGYGRIVTDGAGGVQAIVEEADATDEDRAITLCHSGILAIEHDRLWSLLAEVKSENAKGEYYLTDLVTLGVERGLLCGYGVCEGSRVLGVNTRAQLADLEAHFQNSKRQGAMENGVGLVAPQTVFFSWDTHLEPDTVVEPHVIFGPNVRVETGAVIKGFSYLEGCTVGVGATLGPFARVRPGTEISEGARIGNFVEVKKSLIGKGAKVNHLSYIGDSEVGEGANIGAGVVTCNYDGVRKHRTHIGDGAFVGTNSALVAPITIGEGAYVAAGSVVTSSVAPDALYTTRAPEKIRLNWVKKYLGALLKRSKKTET